MPKKQQLRRSAKKRPRKRENSRSAARKKKNIPSPTFLSSPQPPPLEVIPSPPISIPVTARSWTPPGTLHRFHDSKPSSVPLSAEPVGMMLRRRPARVEEEVESPEEWREEDSEVAAAAAAEEEDEEPESELESDACIFTMDDVDDALYSEAAARSGEKERDPKGNIEERIDGNNATASVGSSWWPF